MAVREGLTSAFGLRPFGVLLRKDLCGFAALGRVLIPPRKSGGEGGIRTLGSLLDYGALAKRCFRPLSHLTGIVSRKAAIAAARRQR